MIPELLIILGGFGHTICSTLTGGINWASLRIKWSKRREIHFPGYQLALPNLHNIPFPCLMTGEGSAVDAFGKTPLHA